MIKAVFFDFDGTIADTLPICIDAFRNTVEPVLRRKLSLEETKKYFGPTEDGIFAKYFPEQQDELLKIYYENYAALQKSVPGTVPGIMELVRALRRKGVRVALITAKGATTCRISLDYYGIADDFEFIRVGGAEGRVKDVQIVEILREINVEPCDAVYVGDSPKDVVSAHKAQVQAWGAAWFDAAVPDDILKNHPERIFYSVAELRAALEEELGDLEY